MPLPPDFALAVGHQLFRTLRLLLTGFQFEYRKEPLDTIGFMDDRIDAAWQEDISVK
jgi:hypothetical protein